jgi:hypothetical protein
MTDPGAAAPGALDEHAIFEEDDAIDEHPATPRAHITPRGAMVVGARLMAGLVGVGVAVATVAAATWLPLPTLGPDPASSLVTPVAALQQRICPGPALQLGDATGKDAATAYTVGAVDVARASTRGTPSLEALPSPGNPGNVPPQKLILSPPAAGEPSGILAGSQSQTVDAGDLKGFAAVQCATSSSDGWLVGGSTVTGRTTLLALSNPSNVPSTVDLQVFSEKGLVAAAGTEGIVVPPGGQRVFSLAAFAPDASNPVVHVVTTGGQIVATLQQSIVRTLDPGGVDVFGVGARPSTLSVIPGIVLTGNDAIEAIQGTGGYQDATPVLRILVPGTQPTEAHITVYPEDGVTAPSSVTLSVSGGVVADFPLGDFPDGSYTLSVATDRPAVVAARAATVTLKGGIPTDPARSPVLGATDFAWFVSAPTLHHEALLSVAPGPSPILHLVNPGDAPAAVTLSAAGAADRTVTVPAGGVAAVPVIGGARYTLSGFDTLRASLSYRGAGALASFVLTPPESASQPMRVFR